jgi:putative oxidoreductase
MSKSTPAHNAGLLALRAGVGGVLIAHGAQKLFGAFGGGGIKGTGAAFHGMGFRPGTPNAVAAGLGEFGGGALLALGLATPVAGAAAAGTMITAASVHAPNGFFAQGGGLEYPALLGLASAALAFSGPGEWSLDRVTGHYANRPKMALIGVLASAALSAVVIAKRRSVVNNMPMATPDTAADPSTTADPATES